MVISVGTMMQSFSGAADKLTNLIFRVFTDDYTAFNSACDGYAASADGSVTLAG